MFLKGMSKSTDTGTRKDYIHYNHMKSAKRIKVDYAVSNALY